MKLSVLQENLSSAISSAAHFASIKAQLPVLGNIKLSTKKTKLQISSTNLEVSVCISVGSQVEEEGEITIPAKTIAEITANLKPGTVRLESAKEQLKIESQGFSSNLSGMNASDFPAIPQTIEAKNSVSLPRDLFLESLSQVIFAASLDETRPILTGILFLSEKGFLTMVATDGFRLSQKKIEVKGLEKGETLVLSKNGLSEISRLSVLDSEILFSFKKTEKQVTFGFTDTILSTRILEGEYPNYEKIIPKEGNLKISVDKEDLLRSIKLAAVFAKDSANIVKIEVGKDSLNLSAESSTSGSQKTKIEAKVEGKIPEDGFVIAYNYRFVEDFLRAVKGEEVQMEFSNPDAPGVFVDPSDKHFLHLIMPVKIQE